MSLLTDPTCARERDRCISLKLRRLARAQPRQPCTRPLSHLAVLLRFPTVHAAELGATHLAREIVREHEPLIA